MADARSGSSPPEVDIASLEVAPEGNDPTRSKSVNILVAGLYSWIATVLLPTFSAPSSFLARGCAIAALASLLGGVLLMRVSQTWGRFATLIGFVGLSAVTWVALGDALDVDRLEPVRAALGGVGWMLFAFGWGAVRRPGAVPERDPHVIVSEPLQPRTTVPVLNSLVFLVSVLLGLVPWFLAWRVVDDERALLAHSVAFACAVAMVIVGSRVSVSLGHGRSLRRPTARLNAASTPLAALLVLGMLGLILWLFAS